MIIIYVIIFLKLYLNKIQIINTIISARKISFSRICTEIGTLTCGEENH